MIVLAVGALVFAACFLCFDAGDRSGCRARARAPAWVRRRVRGIGGELNKLRTPKKPARDAAHDLPEMLDIVGLGLTAGLSFDAALAEYCQESSSQLADGMRSAMLSWQMGLESRHDALVSLSRRLHEPALARFAASVAEALELGTPLAATLERQAQLAREEHQARVEERIEKVPVKMLVPMGTLVVPAMLLAIVGPLVAAMSS